MAGKKGRSGPVGNTNAVKSASRLLWGRGILRAQDMWVRRPLSLYTAGLLADKPNATAGERNVIAVAATAQGCTLLIMNELKQKGFTYMHHGQVELVPAARELARFMSVELTAHKLLNLERRLKPALSLLQQLNGEPVGVEQTVTATPTKVRQTKEPHAC